MEDDYGSNVHMGLEKCPLCGVSALECSLWKGFVVRDSLGIRPGQNFLSALEDVRFREVPLYSKSILICMHSS